MVGWGGRWWPPPPPTLQDTKYVTLGELREMMAPSSGLLWSPWFRIIAEHLLEGWWRDLDHTLGSNDSVDPRIYRITC